MSRNNSEMAKLIFIFGLCIVTSQAASYKDTKLLLRMVRSPHYGGHYHYDYDSPPSPPPSPFLYRTQNWSGVGRSNDGAVKGVFSGAAATAESAVPATNSAFSLAASEAASGSAGFEKDSDECDDKSHSFNYKGAGHYHSKSSQFGSQQFGSGSQSQERQSDEISGENVNAGSSGYKIHSTIKGSRSSSSQLDRNSGSNGYGQEANRGYGVHASDFNSGLDKHSGGYGRRNFKESHYSQQNGRGDQFEAEKTSQGRFSGSGQADSGALNVPQTQASYSDSNSYFGSSKGPASSGSDSDFESGYQNYHSEGHGFGSTNSQAGKSEAFKSQQLISTGNKQSAEQEASLESSAASDNEAQGVAQQKSTLHGALELASQGLQAADNAKCSTCQKGSYALSNAKSYNGAAIALSIGG